MNTDFLAGHPELLAILIALVGFAVAGLLAAWVDRGLNLVERGLRRLSPQRAERLAATPRKLLQRVVYYLTLAFFLLLAIRLLGIVALSDSLDRALAWLPQFLLGGVIIVIGYLLGLLARALLAGRVGPEHGSTLPRLAQAIVFVTAVMTGVEQMGINISFVTTVIVVLLSVSLGGMSLAFALGSRELVANLLARRSLGDYRLGQALRIGETEGVIVEFTRIGVVLETADGTVHVPARKFLESEVTVRDR